MFTKKDEGHDALWPLWKNFVFFVVSALKTKPPPF